MRAWRGAWVLGTWALLGTSACHDSDRALFLSPPPPAPVQPAPAPTPTPIPEQTPPPPPVDPPHDPTPTPAPDGVPADLPGVYDDKGAAKPKDPIRGLISFPIRNRDELKATIDDLYDPQSPNFRHYLTPQQWVERHAPTEKDVGVVVDWLKSKGFKVPRIASNRLLLQFTGTVGDFNEAFGAEVRVLERKSPQVGNEPHDVYGFNGSITAPKFIADRIDSVVALDLPADPHAIDDRENTPSTKPPENPELGLSPQQVAAAYNFTSLYAKGFRGKGVKLGVNVGAAFHMKDARGFWKVFGIQREDPKRVLTMEPPATRYRETQLDVEWAGAMAPEAELIVYMGPDARNTSMLYTFNEAIGRGEVNVLTNSFAHREDAEPRGVRVAYGNSAMMAAAIGMTVVSASGDSAGVDIPSSSPYVTCVGGTVLKLEGTKVVSEVAWEYSGSGTSNTFAIPEWQVGLPGLSDMRGVSDVALNAETDYWYMWLGKLRPNTGTSFAAPIFAGMVASIDSGRLASGRPVLGFINRHLYERREVQRTFRDITEHYSLSYPAHAGWDFPTGWGAPDAQGLLDTLP
ncbi:MULTISPECIES: protease pro-enzyme activation domain-containing protein [Myxococcaceae]|uniref:S53 family peptidase n=1 Tax=Myxococcaceae TaxID=31 RepID=UPI001E3BBA2D|nr:MULTISPECIES: S53 family serine peptidase [Myxococcaceae]